MDHNELRHIANIASFYFVMTVGLGKGTVYL